MVHTLQRDVKRKFPRRRTVVSGVDSQWGIDLASEENISKYNDGISYLLVVIDVFSKFLFIQPLTGRKAKDIVRAFDLILSQGRSPEVVYSDKGSEFNNALFKRYLSKRKLKYFTTQNEDIKVSVAERVIRTIRNKMHKLFQHTRSYRFVERLQELVDSYNSTPHRTLGRGLSPKEINKKNEAEVGIICITLSTPPKLLRIDNLIGNRRLVRLSYKRYTFQRDYQRKWTSEIFKISARFVRRTLQYIKLKTS